MNLRKDHSHEYPNCHGARCRRKALFPRRETSEHDARHSLRESAGGRAHAELPFIRFANFCHSSWMALTSQLSATDASARTTMKGAAKCDKHCKLQNSANQQDFERILRFRDMPESMPGSEPPTPYALGHFVSVERLRASARLRCC